MCYDVINDYPFMRIFPGLVLIRFFFRWQTSKELCYMLRSGAKIVASLLILMLSIFFMFGVVGVTLFKGGLKNAPKNFEPGYSEYANFENLSNAYIFLTQAFLGEAFHELLTVTRACWKENTNGEGEWGGNWFVLIFFFLMSVLFNNLFFGLLLNIFSDLYEAKSSGEQLNKDLVRRSSMPEIEDEENESFFLGDLAEPTITFSAIAKNQEKSDNQRGETLQSLNISQIEVGGEDPVLEYYEE